MPIGSEIMPAKSHSRGSWHWSMEIVEGSRSVWNCAILVDMSAETPAMERPTALFRQPSSCALWSSLQILQ